MVTRSLMSHITKLIIWIPRKLLHVYADFFLFVTPVIHKIKLHICNVISVHYKWKHETEYHICYTLFIPYRTSSVTVDQRPCVFGNFPLYPKFSFGRKRLHLWCGWLYICNTVATHAWTFQVKLSQSRVYLSESATEI